MQIILNTSNARMRDEALHIIIKNMYNSPICIPIAYKLDQSGCSCCRSEYFYFICKIKYEYKIFIYDGYIKHTNKCALIRCSCDEPFQWKNITPTEIDIDSKSLNIINMFETYTSIKDNEWYDDFKKFYEQYEENKCIYAYNEDDNEDENIFLKNYAFYFKL